MTDARTLRRIAALHRELAEAYEQLAADPPSRAKPAPAQRELGPDPNPAVTAKVRRTLRAKGVAA